jgi:hypothetical protein
MEELRLEIIALQDEAIPPHDLAICFELARPGVGFEACTTYEDIWNILHNLS